MCDSFGVKWDLVVGNAQPRVTAAMVHSGGGTQKVLEHWEEGMLSMPSGGTEAERGFTGEGASTLPRMLKFTRSLRPGRTERHSDPRGCHQGRVTVCAKMLRDRRNGAGGDAGEECGVQQPQGHECQAKDLPSSSPPKCPTVCSPLSSQRIPGNPKSDQTLLLQARFTSHSQRIRPLNWALSRGGRPFPGGVLHGWRVLHAEERRQAGVTTPRRPEEGAPRAMQEGSSESLTLAQGTEATQAGRLSLPASLDPHTHPMLGARCSISQRGKGGQQGGFAPPQPRAATFPGFTSQGDFCRSQAPPKGKVPILFLDVFRSKHASALMVF